MEKINEAETMSIIKIIVVAKCKNSIILGDILIANLRFLVKVYIHYCEKMKVMEF